MTHSRARLVSLLALFMALAPPVAAAAPEATSPRAATAGFLDLARAGRFDEAAQLLDLTGLTGNAAQRGPELARRLAAVLERQGTLDLDALSDDPGGKQDDDLPADRDEIGRVLAPDGGIEPIRLRHVDGARWVFAPATVARIDTWFERLPRRWLHERIPEALQRMGPAGLRAWQWLALPLVALLAVAIGLVVSRVTQLALSRLVARTAVTWDDAVLARLRGPLRAAWSVGAALLLLPALDLVGRADTFLRSGLRTALFLVFFWAILRVIDMAAQLVIASPWAAERPSSRSLITLSARIGKVVVLAMALVAALAEFGFPVASLIAGLGIGGLALALAAQKTVENLFGAVSLGIDQPFREGDFVRIEDFVGTVEAIGLRSTRIRTLDRTLITLPNGRLADMRLESFTARDRMRLACIVGLVYSTTGAQVRQVLAGLEEVLRAHPKIWPDAVVVRFQALGASSLDIEVMAWFTTSDWGEFQGIRQEILLSFMEVIERAGTSFAFPTRTVHVVPAGERAAPRAEA
jgi:MscS family membrane protein